MRRLIVSTLLTIDGVMEAPGGEPGHPHTGWAAPFITGAVFEEKQREALEAESLLLGRVTWQSFAEGWAGADGPFGEKMNAMRKDVVTSTLEALDWTNSHVLAGEPIEAVRRLKAGQGGPIMVNGSRMLAQALMQAGLVDEYRLTICPVAVGSGLRLFPDSPDKIEMRAAESTAYENGVVLNVYRA